MAQNFASIIVCILCLIVVGIIQLYFNFRLAIVCCLIDVQISLVNIFLYCHIPTLQLLKQIYDFIFCVPILQNTPLHDTIHLNYG